MQRELTPDRQAAHIATLKTLIFNALDYTKADPNSGSYTGHDVSVAVSTVIDSLATATDECWPDQTFALIGLVSVLGHRLMAPEGRKHIGTAMNTLSALLGAELITTPLKQKLDQLQAFADSVAGLESGPDTNPFLFNIIERARDVSEVRPGGFKSPTPLNDIYRQGQKGLRNHEIPAPPWQAGRDNAKRVGWDSYFQGKPRDTNPFPTSRTDLTVDYQEGWDAAKAHDDAYPFIAPAEDGEA